MSNKLSDLNNHLFAQLDRLSDSNINQEKLETEVKRTESIVKLSQQIIDNSQLTLKAAELVAKHGCGNWENMLPQVEGRPSPPGIKKHENTQKKNNVKIPDYSKEEVRNG